jgi:hypothetical protein
MIEIEIISPLICKPEDIVKDLSSLHKVKTDLKNISGIDIFLDLSKGLKPFVDIFVHILNILIAPMIQTYNLCNAQYTV